MLITEEIKVFEEKRIRSIWNEEQEKWYFSVVDVIGALTDSKNPTDYLKKMRKRDEQLGTYLGTNCPQVAMMTATGKRRKTLAADTEKLLRIIQSIPSVKAEPFHDHKKIAVQGDEVARNARLELEAKTGKSVVSSLNARDTLLLQKEHETNENDVE